jgi:hypothetical protein
LIIGREKKKLKTTYIYEKFLLNKGKNIIELPLPLSPQELEISSIADNTALIQKIKMK